MQSSSIRREVTSNERKTCDKINSTYISACSYNNKKLANPKERHGIKIVKQQLATRIDDNKEGKPIDKATQ